MMGTRFVAGGGCVVLILMGIALGSCGDDRGTRSEQIGRSIAGRYVLDRAATAAALLDAVAALDDEARTARMGPPQDPTGRASWLRHKQDFWRQQAKRTERGLFDQELTIHADGTWEGRYLGDTPGPLRGGTWALHGEELSIAMTYPRRDDDFQARCRNGVIEFLEEPGVATLVLKKE